MIRADLLEETVWEKIAELLQSPQIVMLGMQDYVDFGKGLSNEIRSLESSIASLREREQNLIKMMSVEGIDSELVSTELAPINGQRRAQENRMQQLSNILHNKKKFSKSRNQIRHYLRTLSRSLEGLDEDGKIGTLAAFNVKVTAVKGKLSIELFVDPKV